MVYRSHSDPLSVVLDQKKYALVIYQQEETRLMWILESAGKEWVWWCCVEHAMHWCEPGGRKNGHVVSAPFGCVCPNQSFFPPILDFQDHMVLVAVSESDYCENSWTRCLTQVLTASFRLFLHLYMFSMKNPAFTSAAAFWHYTLMILWHI